MRSVYQKGLLDWLKKEEPDILCLQEIKIQVKQLPPELSKLNGYHSYFHSASRPGYAGTATYTKEKPLSVKEEIGLERFDKEGRAIELKYPDFTLINLYLPHGGRKKENLAYKLEVYAYLFNYLQKIKAKNIILIGDFNIAHEEIDLARPKQNKNNIMFTAEERKQIDKLTEIGFVDTFRKFNKKPGNYTWWPYFAKARERNLGWRIDYVFVSSALAEKVKNAFILTAVMGSDHCPIGIN